ncbi:hypothetical protein Taro_038112 [Colocasia esculenta]|uniref:Uncharacterized protein n=1 Tax=Colocasia esculenta TaxID=4460 RepID=A0A843WL87_COLES|nr:hypothetical protein [Colocasia esculenta]
MVNSSPRSLGRVFIDLRLFGVLMQWRAVVGVVPRLRRTSRDVRRGAQVLAPAPLKHGHGGLSIMERFKRMAPPSFKGESQPLQAESWMREVEKIFRAIRQESEIDQYMEEKRSAQKRSTPPFQRQDRKKTAMY